MEFYVERLILRQILIRATPPTVSPTYLGNCQSDGDCPFKSICFSGKRTTWVKQMYGDATFCDCSRTALHDGYPMCDQATVSFYAELGVNLFELCLVIIAIFIGTYDLFRLKRIHQFQWGKPTVQTSIYLICANSLHILSICFVTVCRYPGIPVNLIAGQIKLCIYFVYSALFTVLAILFSFLAQANVAVVWINLVSNTKSSRPTNKSNMKLKIALYVMQIVYFIVLSVAAGTLNLALALLATIPYCVTLIIGYCFGKRKLSQLLQEPMLHGDNNNENDEEGNDNSGVRRQFLYRSLSRIEIVTLIMGITLSIEVLVIVVASFVLIPNGSQAYEQSFTYRPGAICLLLFQLLTILLNIVVAMYLHSSISSTVQYTLQTSPDRGSSEQQPRLLFHRTLQTKQQQPVDIAQPQSNRNISKDPTVPLADSSQLTADVGQE
jgi:hypothetical protein